VPSDYAPAMMDLLWAETQKHDGCLYGLEALGAMRIEKGHVTGAELDGRVSIDDAGLGKMANPDKVYIGKAMRELEIPVGEVLASPYCRTMETASLMEVGPVQASTDVMNLRSASYFGGREAVVSTARRLLSSPPPSGTNRIIVAHGNVAREATPVYPGEGEGLVFAPDGGGFRLLGRLTPADWQRLAATAN